MSKYFGDFVAGETIKIPFNTFDSDGASVTVTDLAAGDVEIHKDGGTTQRASDSGVSVAIDFDGVTGNHIISIDTSDNTDDGFYATGSDYQVRVEGITVDSQTINAFIGSFSIQNRYMRGTDSALIAANVNVTDGIVESNIKKVNDDATSAANLESQFNGDGYVDDTAPATQAQILNITNVGSAVNTPAESYSLTTGTQSANTYENTIALDGVKHTHTDDTGSMELEYVFNVGAGKPASVTVTGALTGLNDDLNVYAYDYILDDYRQIGTLAGKSSSSNEVNTYNLFTSMVGTGTSLGEVKIKFEEDAASLSSATLYIDQIYVSFSSASSNYENGQIWVDGNLSNTNTVPGIDGVATNPVSTWAAALTLSGLTNIKSFHLSSGTSIELTAASENYSIEGPGATVNLSDESVSGTLIVGATIVGNDSGTNTLPLRLRNCTIGGNSFGKLRCNQCPITGTITLTEATTYIFETCLSAVAGTATPVIDFGSSIGDTNVNFRHYSGGIEIQNMGQSGTDNMSLEGWGQYVLNANCAGGTLAVRGHFKKTDNSGGAVTISDDSNFKSSVVGFGVAQGAGTGNNQIQLSASDTGTSASYDPSEIFIVSGTGAGQTRLILEYNASTKTATVDRDWKTNPDSTSEYRIAADSGRGSTNEGLATGGGNNTITLNALASDTDDLYNGSLVFLLSGTGQDQGRCIIDYDGGTKIATVDCNWKINPDTTTGYMIAPNCDTILNANQPNYAPALASVCTEARLSNLNATISSRSSHDDPDPSGYIDAAISSRSSHDDPDPSGYIDAAISSRSSHSAADVKTAIEAAGSLLYLAKVIADKVDTALEEDGAVYRFTENALEQAPLGTGSSPEAFVTALLNTSGFTAGGTMTFEVLLKILAAFVAGNWQDKSGSSGVYEVKDADSAATTIMEQTLSESTPYKSVNLL